MKFSLRVSSGPNVLWSEGFSIKVRRKRRAATRVHIKWPKAAWHTTVCK